MPSGLTVDEDCKRASEGQHAAEHQAAVLTGSPPSLKSYLDPPPLRSQRRSLDLGRASLVCHLVDAHKLRSRSARGLRPGPAPGGASPQDSPPPPRLPGLVRLASLPPDVVLCLSEDGSDGTPHALPVLTTGSLEAASAQSPQLSAHVSTFGPCTSESAADASRHEAWTPDSRRLVWISMSLMTMLELGTDRGAALERMNRMSFYASAIRSTILGVLRSFGLGDYRPVPFISLVYHSTKPTHFCLVRFSPCVYEDDIGNRFWSMVTQFDSESKEYQDEVQRSLPQEHMALKHTPTLVTLVDAEGAVLSQNDASVDALGVLAASATSAFGRQHFAEALCGVSLAEAAGLTAAAGPPAAAAAVVSTRVNYLHELFHGQQAALDEMLAVTASGRAYKERLQVCSPTLLRWMAVGGGDADAEVWHEVQVARARDSDGQAPVYVIAQVDVTEVVLVKRQVQLLQAQQLTLLSAILPQQVIQVLLQPLDEVARQKGDRIQRTNSSGDKQFLSALQNDDYHPDLVAPRTNSAVGRQVLQRDFCHTALSRLSTFHECVSVLFSDIQGFTAMCEQLHPADVMVFLNCLYSALDQVVEDQGPLGVYKVETIGDSYMVCGGLFHLNDSGQPVLGGRDPEHASKTIAFARAMVAAAAGILTPFGNPVVLRIGINSGSCMSGVVGKQMPRFCLFGDTVNTASRMEACGMPGSIHVSEATRELLPDERWRPSGGVHPKGKGFMQTFYLEDM